MSDSQFSSIMDAIWHLRGALHPSVYDRCGASCSRCVPASVHDTLCPLPVSRLSGKRRGARLCNIAVMPHRPGEAPAGSPKRPAFDLRAWTDRFEQRPYRVPRQPLTSITGHLGSQVSPLALSCGVFAHERLLARNCCSNGLQDGKHRCSAVRRVLRIGWSPSAWCQRLSESE